MRPPPLLQVELTLEREPVVRLYAESAEDEARLLGWLLNSHELRQLGFSVYELLDLYERGEAAA